MIFDIDCKITQTIVKMQSSVQMLHDGALELFNEYLKEKGYDERYVMWGDALKVTQYNSDRIKRIIESDKYQKPAERKSSHQIQNDSDVARSQRKF